MKKINYRKSLIHLMLAPVLLLLFFASCKKAESNIQVISNDMTKPGTVSNINVVNLNGAARITYKLPDSKNILYVLARYSSNDKNVRETKSSYYTDTITVNGFAKAKEYDVTLYVVSRANVMSDPVAIKVNPATPDYLLVNSGLDITPDFGGASFYGPNVNRAQLAIHLLSYNETTNAYDEQEPEYLSSTMVDLAIRDLDVRPHKVGVFTTDRFGNVSDTVFKTITPLFETLLDKSKFRNYPLASDGIVGYGWEVNRLWDGNTVDPGGWHTLSSPRLMATFDMGVTAKISRMVIWQRGPDYYSNQNTKNFTIWGSSKDNPADYTLPRGTAAGTVAGDWVNMGNFSFPNPPSGLPANQANPADKAFVARGVNFTMPRLAPEVKYIRYEATLTWGGLDYVNVMEISMYGVPRN